MLKRQKEVIQYQLDLEEKAIAELERQYKAALFTINRRIKLYQAEELTASRINRINFQKQLKAQVEAILDKLQGDNFDTIQEWLNASYTNSFVGVMYDLAGQGLPVILPIDKKAAAKAILTDSKISVNLYTALGVDIKHLKKAIRQEITRGIASGMPFNDIARNIATVTGAPLSRARAIVRTEGHRIQEESKQDARTAAKTKGAETVKQWDATLDGATRDTHRKLDGQIREIDEPFEANGNKAMYPGGFGDPAEDCECRCVALTRARAAMDADELRVMQDRAAYFELDKAADFEEFKKKFLKAAEEQ